MLKAWRSGIGLLALVWATWAGAQPPAPSATARPVVRVAVVGGLLQSGVWPRLADKAAVGAGLRVDTVAAAPKEGIVPVFARGDADLMLIHGSDESYALLAAGLAAPLRAWAANEHVLVGPADDPAGVAQAADGAAAMARIVAADAPLLAFRDPGSFIIAQALFRRAGVRPGPRQQLYDDAESPQSVLVSAARQGAYAVVGHIPVASGKMPSHGLKVLLHGDPAMRRVYVLVEPGPAHPANAERRRLARRLADYLLSARGQADLRAADREAGGPWVFALTTSGPAR